MIHTVIDEGDKVLIMFANMLRNKLPYEVTDIVMHELEEMNS